MLMISSRGSNHQILVITLTTSVFLLDMEGGHFHTLGLSVCIRLGTFAISHKATTLGRVIHGQLTSIRLSSLVLLVR